MEIRRALRADVETLVAIHQVARRTYYGDLATVTTRSSCGRRIRQRPGARAHRAVRGRRAARQPGSCRSVHRSRRTNRLVGLVRRPGALAARHRRRAARRRVEVWSARKSPRAGWRSGTATSGPRRSSCGAAGSRSGRRRAARGRSAATSCTCGCIGAVSDRLRAPIRSADDRSPARAVGRAPSPGPARAGVAGLGARRGARAARGARRVAAAGPAVAGALGGRPRRAGAGAAVAAAATPLRSPWRSPPPGCSRCSRGRPWRCTRWRTC